jgi:hypothetical protein
MVPNVMGSREGWGELYIQLPFFSASHNIGHHPIIFMSDFLMMAF